jgi:single-strand DNA-binding protein
MKNNVQLIGNLGKNPEIRTATNGKKYATFSMATTEYYKAQDGTKKENVVWHNILLWEKQAEIAERFLVKGSTVGIQARLTNRMVKDAAGKDRSEYQLQVTDLMLLGGKRSESNSEGGSTYNTDRIVTAKEVNENLPF